MIQLYDELVVIIKANVRNGPGGQILTQWDFGKRVVCVGGPTQAQGLTWWQVRNGLTGWVAERAANQAILIDRLDTTPFGLSLAFILNQEEGEVDNPDDPGGYTKWGISQVFNPEIDVRAMTLEQCKQLYRRKYWELSGADKLPWPFCLAAFNFAVTSGVGAARSLLEKHKDYAAFMGASDQYYRSLKNFHIFGQSWLNRLGRLDEIVSHKTLQ